jgi:beta-carotene hydroxylase
MMTTLPTLRELGEDLLMTTRRQRVWGIARPYIGVGLFFGVAWLGW